MVLEALERMTNHLTAAVVSNDVGFVQRVLGVTNGSWMLGVTKFYTHSSISLGSSVNGTTYCGIRARTTGIRGEGG